MCKDVFEKIDSIEQLTDADFILPYRSVELPSVSDEINNAIPMEGRSVIIKKSIFEKNISHKELLPIEAREIIKKALYETDVLINDKPNSKPNYWVLVNLGERFAMLNLDTDKRKTYVEVVGWRLVRERSYEQIKNRAIREGGQILITQKGAAGLSALTNSSVSSTKV